MAATFVPDTVDGSSLDFQQGNASKVRGGFVTGLTGDPATAVEQCFSATGMPLLGSSITVTAPGISAVSLIFRRLVVRPVSPDTCAVQLVYDNISGLTPTAYTIRSRSFEQSVETDFLLGTHAPVYIPPWTNPADAKDYIFEDVWTRTTQRTMTEVTVSGLRVGSPPMDYEAAVNLCNNSPWRGRPTGYWRITDGGTSISVYTNYYEFTLSALTKNDEDWSQYGILINSVSGRKAKLADADVTSLTSPGYSHGVIATCPGGMRVGDYGMTSFPAIFGF